jgi:hypothetical protein
MKKAVLYCLSVLGLIFLAIILFITFLFLKSYYFEYTNKNIMESDYLNGSFTLDCIMAVKSKYPQLLHQYPLTVGKFVCKSSDIGICDYFKEAGQFTQVVIINFKERSPSC